MTGKQTNRFCVFPLTEFIVGAHLKYHVLKPRNESVGLLSFPFNLNPRKLDVNRSTRNCGFFKKKKRDLL